MAKLAKKHYVNNKDLYTAILAYKEKVDKAKVDGRNPPVIPDYIGICFMLICNKLSTKPNFMGYSYRDEMVADGIKNCVAAANGFDPLKSSNPFAYFTQIAWNAFLQRINKEKKQAYIKHKNFENSGIMDELYEQQDGSHAIQVKHNEYSDDIIRNFENKLIKTTKKAKVGLELFVEEEVNEELTPSAS